MTPLSTRTRSGIIPPLANGDWLTAGEFLRRYEAMPDVKKAELVEGVVYMPSPVSMDDHAEPHLSLAGWLLHYVAQHPDTQGGDNGTVRLDERNVPQPDLLLRRRSGGTSTGTHFVEGPPELIIEVSARVRRSTCIRRRSPTSAMACRSTWSGGRSRTRWTGSCSSTEHTFASKPTRRACSRAAPFRDCGSMLQACWPAMRCASSRR